jgi:hypothetical protein
MPKYRTGKFNTLITIPVIDRMSSRKPERNGRLQQFVGRLVFISAALITGILVIMGVTGMHWPKWLLALTTIL